MTMSVNPQLLAKQATDTSDMIRFKQEMDGLKDRLAGDSGNKEKELRKACQDFEAVFITKLWKGMKSTVPQEGYLHSKQEEQYLSMFDKEFAENMSRAGGIGLADMIYDQLSQKLQETSRDALAGSVDIRPIVAQPKELNQEKAIPLVQQKGMTLEDWGGATTNLPQAEIMRDEKVVTAAAMEKSMPNVLNDMEVKAQLDALARKLEAERIKSQLLGSGSMQGQNYDKDSGGPVGRKLAEIG